MSFPPFGATIIILVALIGIILICAFVVIFGVYLIFFNDPGKLPPAEEDAKDD